MQNTYILFKQKDNLQNGKSVCANYVTDQEMNFQNIQMTYIAQHLKKKNTPQATQWKNRQKT